MSTHHPAVEQPGRRASPPLAGDSAATPLECFLVEDNGVILQNVIATLEELLDVRVVGNAPDERSAVRWMQQPGARCDLMIVDIFLKSGTGLGVLARARTLQPQAHRVVLTNYATPDMRRRCLEQGAERVFDKSAELEEMLDYCGALCAQRG